MFELSVTPTEGGSIELVAGPFTDFEEQEVTPDTLTYTFTDVSGNVLHELNRVALTPAAIVYWVLNGDRLDVIAGISNKRVVIVEATFTSDRHGPGMSLRAAATFDITGLPCPQPVG